MRVNLITALLFSKKKQDKIGYFARQKAGGI